MTFEYPDEVVYARAEQARKVRDQLNAVRTLHAARWDNCINACCSGEQCKHRSRQCDGCDEYWPCATAKLVYSDDDLAAGGEQA